MEKKTSSGKRKSFYEQTEKWLRDMSGLTYAIVGFLMLTWPIAAGYLLISWLDSLAGNSGGGPAMLVFLIDLVLVILFGGIWLLNGLMLMETLDCHGGSSSEYMGDGDDNGACE